MRNHRSNNGTLAAGGGEIDQTKIPSRKLLSCPRGPRRGEQLVTLAGNPATRTRGLQAALPGRAAGLPTRGLRAPSLSETPRPLPHPLSPPSLSPDKGEPVPGPGRSQRHLAGPVPENSTLPPGCTPRPSSRPRAEGGSLCMRGFSQKEENGLRKTFEQKSFLIESQLGRWLS